MDINMKKIKTVMIILCCLTALNFVGCATVPTNVEGRNVLTSQVDEAIAAFKNKDPEIQRFFDTSYGYAVFPKVGKAAFVVGGAFGRGQVFTQKELVGYSSISQASIGFSFGGESFREIIFFESKEDLEEFQAEEYTFSAQVSGVALTAGAAAKANYNQGKIVFIIAESGLMVDVSLGGQKFKYIPLSKIGLEKKY
jgi:lipid-binding SYLF domain-containing protein